MDFEKRIKDHFNKFKGKGTLSKTAVLAITLEGQVLAKIGGHYEKGAIQSFGALMTGLLQASASISDLMGKDNKEEVVLSYQTTSSGFFILPPNETNRRLFWAFMFDNEQNPGKIKLYAKKLRTHMNEVSIIEEREDDEILFKDITDKELDDLFSFAGI